MMITRAVVPTLFTVLNMFCGFLSIVQVSEGKFIEAGYFILLAGVFDSLDGVMARLTQSTSRFGVEIDSLSDVVSFGAAPAFLVYKLHLFQLGTVGLIISSLLVILGGIRLARFNVQLVGFDKEYFRGLPIPSSAIAIVFYVLTFSIDGNKFEGFSGTVLPYIVIALSLLMVSTIKYDTLPKLSKKEIAKHPIRFSSYFFAVLIVVFTKGEWAFYVFSVFIVFGILRHMIGLVKHEEKIETEIEDVPSYDL
ncbi:MAG TPA: CDP-diacylglycerol--serine O-phosphatidyltransferase [Bacteroidetes bacterium]|nr:CDP-diacylglycerol--serine O-phosphatidyltransferase [Bacteroidota bacterium]